MGRKVTILFTDIEGSTTRWERAPEAMNKAVALHDRLVREAVESAGGKVVKGLGDGLIAEFVDAPDAVTASVVAQGSIAAAAFRDVGGLAVRMGIHTGEVEDRDGDIFGPTVNRGARLAGAAAGGQIVISAATQSVLGGSLPGHVTLIDLGKHLLKGLEVSDGVFQVVAPGLNSEFPPLKSLGRNETNLPAQTTEFIGRERELNQVIELTRANRLVTLLGPGGVGKTRLGFHSGAELVPEFPNGVWLVELAPVGPTDVMGAIAAVLGVKDSRSSDVASLIAESIGDRPTLLILDNLEHVTAALPDIQSLLTKSRVLKTLATSRVPLRLAGEHLYEVRPLESHSIHSAAIDLFVSRAKRVGRTFVESELSDVANVCKRLDGLPLAIELVASRARTLSVPTMHQRLGDRMDLASGSSESGLAHHQSVETAIAWSYDLLSEEAKITLARLSVFAGAFTLESAEEVVGFGALADGAVLDGVVELVDHSLVTLFAEHDRYHMLETIRRFGLERLQQTGDTAETSSRHAHHYADVAHRIRLLLSGPEQDVWRRRVEDDMANIRAALRHAVETDPEVALRIASGIQPIWALRGNQREALELIELALKAAPSHDSVARARSLADRAALTFGLRRPRDEVESHLAEAWRIAVATDDPWSRYRVLETKAQFAAEDREIGLYLDLLRQGLESLGDSGMPWASRPRYLMAIEYADNGHLAEALAMADRLQEGAVAAGDRWGVERARYIRARVAYYRGDLERAEALAGQVINWAESVGSLVDQLAPMTVLAFSASERSELEATETIANRGDGILAELGTGGTFACYAVARAGARLRDGLLAQSIEALRIAAKSGAGELCQELRVMDLAAMIFARIGEEQEAAQLVVDADAFHQVAGTRRVPVWEHHLETLRRPGLAPRVSHLSEVSTAHDRLFAALDETIETIEAT